MTDDRWADAAGWSRLRLHHALSRDLGGGRARPEMIPALKALLGPGSALDAAIAAVTGGDAAAGFGAVMSAPADPLLLLEFVRRRSATALQRAGADGAEASRHLAWPISDLSLAAVIGYRASGDERFLRVVSRSFDRAIELCDTAWDDCRGGDLTGWGGTHLVRGKRTTNITAAGRIPYGALLALRLAGDRAPFLNRRRARYLKAATAALSHLEGDFVLLEGGEGYYRVACGETAEPLNHMAAGGVTLLALHDLTGDPGHLEKAEALARYVAASIFDDGGRPVWRYSPQPGDPRAGKPEWVWKAAVTVHFLKAAAERGLVFGHEDLAAVAGSIHRGAFRPRGVLGAGFESGTPVLDDFGGEVLGGLGAYLSLLELAGAEAGIGQTVERLAGRPESGGWLSGTRASIGYAWRLLLESGREATVLG